MGIIDESPKDENDLPHGKWLGYYDNGQLEYSINFVHNISHGLWMRYHFNGKLCYRGNFNMNRRIGYWYFYGEKYYYLWLI